MAKGSPRMPVVPVRCAGAGMAKGSPRMPVVPVR
jgi:hypothetical protein